MLRASWHIRTALVVALLCATRTLGAQGSLGSERADASHFTGDIWAVWTSPVHTRPRDLGTIAATLAGAAVVSRFDSAAYVWMQGHERTMAMLLLKPIREGARFSSYEFGSGQYLLPASAALYLSGRFGHSVALRDAGLGCAAGHLASLGLRQVVFRSVSRARPKVSASPFKFGLPGSSDWNLESFYSGHISNSMACASFLTHRFAMGLAEPLPYIFSIGIGVGRLADGHHWASDMLIGGVVGFAVGKAIADRQLRREEVPVPGTVVGANRAPLQVPVFQWSVAF